MNVDKQFLTKWLARLSIGNYALLLVYVFFGVYADVLLIVSLLVFGSPLVILYAVKCRPIRLNNEPKLTGEEAQQILAEFRAMKERRTGEAVEPKTDHAYKELLEVFNGGDKQK